MIERQEKDDRIVYGANCAWWGGIENIGRLPSRAVPGTSIPCCPVCRGMLFEIPDAKTWWASVDKYARENSDPGYRGFVEWLRLKHFKDFAEAREVYNAGADKRPGRVKIKGLRP